jgi:hypothetical protein
VPSTGPSGLVDFPATVRDLVPAYDGPVNKSIGRVLRGDDAVLVD